MKVIKSINFICSYCGEEVNAIYSGLCWNCFQIYKKQNLNLPHKNKNGNFSYKKFREYCGREDFDNNHYCKGCGAPVK